MQVYGVSFGTSARGGKRPGGRVSRRVPAAILWATDGVAGLTRRALVAALVDGVPAVAAPAPGSTARDTTQDGAEHRDSRQDVPREILQRGRIARISLTTGQPCAAGSGTTPGPANDHALFALVSLCLRQCGPPWGRIPRAKEA